MSDREAFDLLAAALFELYVRIYDPRCPVDG